MHNPEDYMHLKEKLLEVYDKGGEYKLDEFCVLYSVPFIVAIILVLEERESEDLLAKLDRLRRF